MDRRRMNHQVVCSSMQSIAPLKCPLCNSQRIWKDGIRYTKDGDVQRYICRSCGHRFSQSKRLQNTSGSSLNRQSALTLHRHLKSGKGRGLLVEIQEYTICLCGKIHLNHKGNSVCTKWPRTIVTAFPVPDGMIRLLRFQVASLGKKKSVKNSELSQPQLLRRFLRDLAPKLTLRQSAEKSEQKSIVVRTSERIASLSFCPTG